jgi:hypothetical protein
LPKSLWQVKCGFVNEVNTEVWRGNTREIGNSTDQLDNVSGQFDEGKEQSDQENEE